MKQISLDVLIINVEAFKTRELKKPIGSWEIARYKYNLPRAPRIDSNIPPDS